MLKFILNFMDDRKFRVLVGDHATAPRCVLSVTILFFIMNGIRNCVISPVRSFTFAGEKIIYMK